MQASMPTYYLDSAIVRVAVLRARELIAQGRSTDEAVRIACAGPWATWRNLVLEQVLDCEATPRAV